MGQLLIFYLQHLILTLPQKSQGVGLFAIPLPPPVCTTVGKTRNVLNNKKCLINFTVITLQTRIMNKGAPPPIDVFLYTP